MPLGLRPGVTSGKLAGESAMGEGRPLTVLCPGAPPLGLAGAAGLGGTKAGIPIMVQDAPLSGEGQLIRARVLASSGDPLLAHRAVESALELLHPESLEAREARELLATLTPGN